MSNFVFEKFWMTTIEIKSVLSHTSIQPLFWFYVGFHFVYVDLNICSTPLLGPASWQKRAARLVGLLQAAHRQAVPLHHPEEANLQRILWHLSYENPAWTVAAEGICFRVSSQRDSVGIEVSYLALARIHLSWGNLWRGYRCRLRRKRCSPSWPPCS